MFDPTNEVVKLCAEGMELHGCGDDEAAAVLFNTAWNIATDDIEKFTAAHYVARVQLTLMDKLNWDMIALSHALKVQDPGVQGSMPSLYLNIAKGYEDTGDLKEARKYYNLALLHCDKLVSDGYSRMIKAGIEKGLERISSC